MEVLADLDPEEEGAESLEVGEKEKDLSKFSNNIPIEDISHDGVLEEDKSNEHLENREEEDEEGEEVQIITPR